MPAAVPVAGNENRSVGMRTVIRRRRGIVLTHARTTRAVRLGGKPIRSRSGHVISRGRLQGGVIQVGFPPAPAWAGSADGPGRLFPSPRVSLIPSRTTASVMLLAQLMFKMPNCWSGNTFNKAPERARGPVFSPRSGRHNSAPDRVHRVQPPARSSDNYQRPTARHGVHQMESALVDRYRLPLSENALRQSILTDRHVQRTGQAPPFVAGMLASIIRGQSAVRAFVSHRQIFATGLASGRNDE